MTRSNYEFADVSHHKGDLDHSVFPAYGHRLAIVKASDNYHLPDKEGKYDFAAERHYDSRFHDNVMGFRAAGLPVGMYHFARFDRPLGVTRAQIVDKNLEYYLQAISFLPSPLKNNVKCGILDMEQSATQLEAAGFTRKGVAINDMALAMVKLWHQTFDYVIFYAGSWWTDEWLTAATTDKIADMTMCWEPEYVSGALSLDKQHLGALKKEYIPKPPIGFEPQFMIDLTQGNGKLFAWQFTAHGRVPPHTVDIDLNVTELPKDQLYKLFNMDGAVDPPPEPPEPPEPPLPPEPTDPLVRIEKKLDRIISKLGA